MKGVIAILFYALLAGLTIFLANTEIGLFPVLGSFVLGSSVIYAAFRFSPFES
jgi:hypothetical protein